MSNLPSKVIFTYEQEICLELLSKPKRGGLTLEQVAAVAGVNEGTLRRWRLKENFQREIQRRVMLQVSERISDVMDTTVNKAISGSSKHAELVLKSLHIINDQNNNLLILPPDKQSIERSNEWILADIQRLRKQLGEPPYEEPDEAVIDVQVIEINKNDDKQ